MKKLILALGILLAVPVAFSGTAVASDLTLTATQYSGPIPKNSVRTPFLTVLAETKGNYPIEINALTIRRNGLSSSGDFGRMIAIANRSVRSMNGRFNNDDLATLKFRDPVTVFPHHPMRIEILGNTRFEGIGRTFNITLDSADTSAGSCDLRNRDVRKPKRDSFYRELPIWCSYFGRYCGGGQYRR